MQYVRLNSYHILFIRLISYHTICVILISYHNLCVKMIFFYSIFHSAHNCLTYHIIFILNQTGYKNTNTNSDYVHYCQLL